MDAPHAKHWMDRRFGECAYPIGEGPDLLSCCAPITKPKSPYCDAHRALCFWANQPPPLRKLPR